MRKTKPVVLTRHQRVALKAILNSARPETVINRAQIVLLAAKSMGDKAIADTVGVSRPMVALWRDQFPIVGIKGLIEFAPRSGRPRILTAAERDQIVKAGRKGVGPDGQVLSCRIIAKSQKRKVSHTMIARTLQKKGVKLPRAERFDIASNQDFFRSIRDVFGFYTKPPDRALVLVTIKTRGAKQDDVPLVVPNSGLFRQEDILNPWSCINRLRGSRELDGFLWNRLAPEIAREPGNELLPDPRREPGLVFPHEDLITTQDHAVENSDAGHTGPNERLLSILANPGLTEPLLRVYLINLLNNAIRFGPLYDPRLFRSISLEPEIQHLVGQVLPEPAQTSLNRRLLVLAYPSEFLDFFALPPVRLRRREWDAELTDLLPLFSRFEAKISNQGTPKEFLVSFLGFLEAVDSQRRKDIERHGDLWPILAPDGAKPLFEKQHELHVIASGSSTPRHPSVAQWFKRHPAFTLHNMPRANDWFNTLEKWIREVRKLRFHRTMFQRLRCLLVGTYHPGKGVLPLYADRHIGTGWWPDSSIDIDDD